MKKIFAGIAMLSAPLAMVTLSTAVPSVALIVVNVFLASFGALSAVLVGAALAANFFLPGPDDGGCPPPLAPVCLVL